MGIGGVYYISEPIRMCRRWEIARQLNFNLTHSLRSNLSHHNVSQENHAWQLIYAVHPDDLVKPREPASPRVSPSNERESVLSCRPCSHLVKGNGQLTDVSPKDLSTLSRGSEEVHFPGSRVAGGEEEIEARDSPLSP